MVPWTVPSTQTHMMAHIQHKQADTQVATHSEHTHLDTPVNTEVNLTESRITQETNLWTHL